VPVRGRQIRFRGGVWDGVRVVSLPLAFRVSVPAPMRPSLGAACPTSDAPLFPIDTYHLVRYIDHTGIPEMQYHLREMVR